MVWKVCRRIFLVYLYGSAGIDAFIGAIFYLVAANRVNKHGLLFAWAAVYGVIQGVMGYMFLIPYADFYPYHACIDRHAPLCADCAA